jgi:hypothetical protein
VPKACVFCGDDTYGITAEHVFGDWISKFFTQELGVQLEGLAELVSADGTSRKYPMTPFQQTVKIACKSCNNGWMSDLEKSVMDDLKVMMKGQPKMLRAAAKQRLAFWCAKTALVADYLHPKQRIVPDAHFRDLFTHRSALRSQFVLLGFRSVTAEQPGELLASILKQPVLNVDIPTDFLPSHREQILRYAAEGHIMYKVTFAVGNVAALVFGHDFPMGVGINSPRPIAKHIWPISRRFKWSDELSIDAIGGLPAFHAAFGPGPDASALPMNVPGLLPVS